MTRSAWHTVCRSCAGAVDTPTCATCVAAVQAAVDDRVHRVLRVLQAARDWYETRTAMTMAAMVDAIRDGIAKADSRTVAERLREAEEMAARWTAAVERLRGECHVGQETGG